MTTFLVSRKLARWEPPHSTKFILDKSSWRILCQKPSSCGHKTTFFPPWRGEGEGGGAGASSDGRGKSLHVHFLHSVVLRRLRLLCPREFFFSFPDLGNATSGEHDFFPFVPPRTNWRARKAARRRMNVLLLFLFGTSKFPRSMMM